MYNNEYGSLTLVFFAEANNFDTGMNPFLIFFLCSVCAVKTVVDVVVHSNYCSFLLSYGFQVDEALSVTFMN